MAISNELSSDIAVAILAAKNKSARELNDLKEIVLKVHSTLQDMEARSRNDRAFSQAVRNNQNSYG